MSSKEAWEQEVLPIVDMLEDKCEKLGFELFGYVMVWPDSENANAEVDIYNMQVSDVELDEDRLRQIVDAVEGLKAKLSQDEVKELDVDDTLDKGTKVMVKSTGENGRIHHRDRDGTYVVSIEDNGPIHKKVGLRREDLDVKS